MTFELTSELLSSILKALENQEKRFCVDAKNGILAEKTDRLLADENLYYDLPSWDSADGFSLMEEFAGGLHSPFAREALQQVLQSGKGVFRGFKDVLKSYPLVERRWHFFKSQRLLFYVREWYNSLCETWGLQKQGEDLDLQGEELCDLLKEDFVFREYDFQNDREDALLCIKNSAKEFESEWGSDFSCAVDFLWQSEFFAGKNQTGFVCHSQQGEFAGVAVFSKAAERAFFLSALFVKKEFRGLGIARELFFSAMQTLRQKKARWVFVANAFAPPLLHLMLERAGFKKIGSSFVADLFA